MRMCACMCKLGHRVLTPEHAMLGVLLNRIPEEVRSCTKHYKVIRVFYFIQQHEADASLSNAGLLKPRTGVAAPLISSTRVLVSQMCSCVWMWIIQGFYLAFLFPVTAPAWCHSTYPRIPQCPSCLRKDQRSRHYTDFFSVSSWTPLLF